MNRQFLSKLKITEFSSKFEDKYMKKVDSQMMRMIYLFLGQPPFVWLGTGLSKKPNAWATHPHPTTTTQTF
jgi:hypothetical protein